jgi:hypothetical protein
MGKQPHGSRPRWVNIIRFGVLLLAVGCAVSACSWKSLSMSATVRPTHSAASTASTASAHTAKAGGASPAATSAVPTVLPPLVRGALAAGSTTHEVAAGNRTLVIDYWTTQDVASWTSNRSVPIQVSAHMEDSDSAHAVEVTQFKATLSTDASANVTTLMADSGQFVITPPYSYGSVITLPAQPSTARSATISIQFDLLIETAPKSGQFFRQTVLDSLAITFIHQSASAPIPAAETSGVNND